MAVKRTRELKPLSSEHHHALLVTFQLKKGIAGHGESAGAPRDLPGLLELALRFRDRIFNAHARAEEELLGRHLAANEIQRLTAEHAELARLLGAARGARPPEMRACLIAFAELLERHVRWEERELFPECERRMGHEALSRVGHELERRLVLARTEPKASRRA